MRKRGYTENLAPEAAQHGDSMLLNVAIRLADVIVLETLKRKMWKYGQGSDLAIKRRRRCP